MAVSWSKQKNVSEVAVKLRTDLGLGTAALADADDFATAVDLTAALDDFSSEIASSLASKVDVSRQVIAGLGLTGGGNLNDDRTISLSVASQAEAEAGTENTKAMTALRTKQQIDARFKTYKSSEIVLVTSSVTTLTHGLGAEPKQVNAYLLCKIAEKGYAVGAKVYLPPSTQQVGSGAHAGIQLSKPNESTIDVSFGNYLPNLSPRTGGAALAEPHPLPQPLIGL